MKPKSAWLRLLMTHLTSNYYSTYYLRSHGLAAYLPAVIYYHTHFLLTIIIHVGGSNWVNTGPMKHWLLFFNNTKPIKIPGKPFLRQSTRFKFTPTKRRYSLSWPNSKGSSWYLSVSHQSFQENLWMSNKWKSFYTIKESGKVVGRERHTL